MGKKLTIEEVKKRAKAMGAWEVLDDADKCKVEIKNFVTGK